MNQCELQFIVLSVIALFFGVAFVKCYFLLEDEKVKMCDKLVSTKKKPPLRIQGNKVLGYGNGYIFECEFDDGYWCNIGGETMTHWMPLPDIPKLREGEDE